MGSTDCEAMEGVGDKEMKSFDELGDGFSMGFSSFCVEGLSSRLSRCESPLMIKYGVCRMIFQMLKKASGDEECLNPTRELGSVELLQIVSGLHRWPSFLRIERASNLLP